MCGLAVLTAVAQCDPPQVSVASTAGSVCEGGSVTLQVSVSNASQNLPVPPVAVGDVLCSDNSIVKISSWPGAGKTAKGVVFYVDNTGQHGWVVHLQDQGTSVQWTPYGQYTDISTLTNYTNARDAITDLNGYSNTQKIRNAGNATKYPAAYAVDFANGWYLPAAGQLRLLFGEIVTLNASLQVVGGTQFPMDSGWWYWSSTENGQSFAWTVEYHGLVYSYYKFNDTMVRSVRAF